MGVSGGAGRPPGSGGGNSGGAPPGRGNYRGIDVAPATTSPMTFDSFGSILVPGRLSITGEEQSGPAERHWGLPTESGANTSRTDITTSSIA
jgi:hypothetical protein